jgi:RNA 3'-terminal phosphate cyclase (ATP)
MIKMKQNMKIIDRSKMLIIDGSKGEGGGQIVRSSLSLSMCIGRPVRIENIRAGRKKPGLLRQHLTCLRASQAICEAQVIGDELGSMNVEFIPSAIKAGDYDFAIGSAGSTSLVFQTILPALLMADSESTVTLSGGTHNGMAPSFDFIKDCFLKTLADININVDTTLNAYGFYPNGGGQWQAKVHPLKDVKTLNLTERGKITQTQAIVTQSGISKKVAIRALNQVKKKLEWPESDLFINQVASVGAGNIISLQASHSQAIEIVEVVGERRLSAERVAGRAVAIMKEYLDSSAAVGEYLCDQLLLPLVLGKGGCFTTLKLSSHTLTNIDVIKQFIDCDIDVMQLGKDCFKVTIDVK